MRSPSRPCVAALIVLGICMACAGALVAQNAPRTIKDGVLDEIQLLVPTLPTPAAEKIVLVRPFNAAEADLGTGAKGGKKARVEEAAKMQQDAPGILATALVARLKENGAFKEVRLLGEGETPAADAIVVEGKFTALDPGSRAQRYLAGFGAGKSTVGVRGAVKDGAGTVLAEFGHQRHGSMGVGGGDSLDKLQKDSKSIGEDVAKFLDTWARGKSLK